MHRIIVTEEFANYRIDKLLHIRFNLNNNIINKLARTKKIKINNSRAKSNDIINQGDRITIYADIEIKPAQKKQQYNIPPSIINKIKSNIIFDDENVIVIDKPSGISVQRGADNKFALIDVINKLYLNAKIVHRLDKNTQGIIVFAKNRTVAAYIGNQFAQHKVIKEYLAVLDGIPSKESGIIECKIQKLPTTNESRACINENGETSISYYNILEKNHSINRSLVRFLPKTGKMHQIRLHAFHIQCPIFGDEKYNPQYQKGQNLHLISKSINIDGIGEFISKRSFPSLM